VHDSRAAKTLFTGNLVNLKTRARHSMAELNEQKSVALPTKGKARPPNTSHAPDIWLTNNLTCAQD